MAKLIIPVDGEFSSQKMDVSLDNRRYQLHIYFSFREESWLLDIFDRTGTILLVGIKLLFGQELIQKYKVPNTPPGKLYLEKSKQAGVQPGRADFGIDRPFELIYEEFA